MSTASVPFGYDLDDDTDGVPMQIEESDAVPTGGARARAPAPPPVLPAWFPTRYPKLDECKPIPRSVQRRGLALDLPAGVAPRFDGFWNRPDDRDVPFMRCPHFTDSNVEIGIQYGCCAHASTPTQLMMLFSPIVDMKLTPAPVPHGARQEEMKEAIMEEWQAFWEKRCADPLAQTSLDGCAGRCRTCLRLIPPHLMFWAMTEDQTELFTTRGIWAGRRLATQPGLVPCKRVRELVFNQDEQFYAGCCNFHVKGDRPVQDLEARHGFSEGDDREMVCNLCTSGQGSFVDQEHVVKKYVDRDNGAKDTMKQAEEILHPAENFFHAIGIGDDAGVPVMTEDAVKKEWSCKAHKEYDHECEACWACHPCECPARTRPALTREGAIRRLLRDTAERASPLWEKYDRQKQGALDIREIFQLYKPETQKKFQSYDSQVKHNRRVEEKMACAIRLRLDAYEAARQKTPGIDDRDETEADKDRRELCESVDKVVAENVFSFHDCECDAHRQDVRVRLQQEQRRGAPFAKAVHAARQRWDECMMWFHLLWGRKADGEERQDGDGNRIEGHETASPYLEPGDRGMYEFILNSALKNPELYYAYSEMRPGVVDKDGNECEVSVGNAMQWSILIAMMVQFRKCAVRLKDKEMPKDGCAPTVDMDDANRAIGFHECALDLKAWAGPSTVWGVLSDYEKERWTYEAMVQYCAASKELYTDKSETLHTMASGHERQAGASEKDKRAKQGFREAKRRIDRAQGYRDANEHTLSCYVPKFLQRHRIAMMEAGRGGVAHMEGAEGLSAEKMETAQEMASRIQRNLRTEKRDHLYMITTLDELIGKTGAANETKRFWTAGVPDAIFGLFINEGYVFRENKMCPVYEFKDLEEGRGFLTLPAGSAVATKAQQARDRTECIRADRRWQLWMDEHAVGFENEESTKLEEGMFSRHERAEWARNVKKLRKEKAEAKRAKKAAEQAAAKAEQEAKTRPKKRERQEAYEAAAAAGPARKKYNSENGHLRRPHGETSAAAAAAAPAAAAAAAPAATAAHSMEE